MTKQIMKVTEIPEMVHVLDAYIWVEKYCKNKTSIHMYDYDMVEAYLAGYKNAGTKVAR